ncbi:helix-turn-helix transcriptional regulator [Aquitalea sp. LB_tupeE]|nr:helix-turn-helix transcriptional regulator [Aquitalea sp. LB_tupeE]
MSTKLPAVDPRQLRRQLGMNQSEFWQRIDVTQSGGSRYESGRPMPKPVRRLLGVVYLKETVTPFTPETHNT